MNKRIRFFILACIVISIISVILFSLLTILGSKYLVGSKYDTRAYRTLANIKRGNIYDINDNIINYSEYDGEKYIRKYNYPGLYSHMVGYIDYKYGATGLEELYNSTLQGVSSISQWTKIQNTFFNLKSGEHLRLCSDVKLQNACKRAMGKNDGAIIITNPDNGEVLAYYSSPNFDERYLEDSINSDNSKMLDRVKNGKYSPGSVFKIVTALNILNNNTSLEYVDEGFVKVGDGIISNYGKIRYGNSDLHKALVNSSNTYFAEKGLEYNDQLIELTRHFGKTICEAINNKYALNIRKGDNDFKNAILQIGQGEVTASPMAINLITQAIYNGGYFYKPKYVKNIISNDFKIERSIKSNKINLPIKKEDAEYIKEALFDVVKIGTAKGHSLGDNCGGKTGTAELHGNKYNYWFTGFSSGENPKIITIVVENVNEMGYNIAVEIFKSILKQNL